MKDPGVEEIREARHEISAEHGHDLHKVVEYYRQVEKELRNSERFSFGSPLPRARRAADS
jgi:hypothetical protein